MDHRRQTRDISPYFVDGVPPIHGSRVSRFPENLADHARFSPNPFVCQYLYQNAPGIIRPTIVYVSSVFIETPNRHLFWCAECLVYYVGVEFVPETQYQSYSRRNQNRTQTNGKNGQKTSLSSHEIVCFLYFGLPDCRKTRCGLYFAGIIGVSLFV